MQYIADLHIHSRYSRATSKASHLHGLATWAAIKGIQVVGTGDFTHPAWFAHICETLEEAEPGFFRLRDRELEKLRNGGIDPGPLPAGVAPDPAGIRFVLTSEISSIYKRGGRVRKVHNVLFAPDLESVRRFNATLAGIGNLEATAGPSWGSIPGTCSRSSSRPCPRVSWFRPISGHPGSPCSDPGQVLMPSRSVSTTWWTTSLPWRPAFPLTRT